MTCVRMLKLVLVAVMLMGMTNSAGAVVNLVRNGDFEQIVQPRSRQISVNGINGPEQYLTDWTNGTASDGNAGYNFYVTGGSADLDPTNTGTWGSAIQTNDHGYMAIAGPGNGPNNGFVGSPTGNTILIADGNYEVAPISQQIDNLIAGRTYTLRFDWGGAQQFGYTGGNTEFWEVGLGNAPLTTAQITGLTTAPVTIDSQGFSGWQRASMQFTANGGTQILSFLAHGGPNGAPPMLTLDGVQLTANAVPEPASWALMAIGFASVGLALRRRRTRAPASPSATRLR